MLPFEFIVEGPPVSYQTRRRENLKAWQATVRIAAQVYWPEDALPFTESLKFSITYFHDGTATRIDNDNLVKPLQDALNGLIYVDDRQITDTQIRKTDINGKFQVRGISPVLADGFCRGNEFLYVRIELAPDHSELL